MPWEPTTDFQRPGQFLWLRAQGGWAWKSPGQRWYLGWTWWAGGRGSEDRLYLSSPLPLCSALSPAPMPTMKTHSVLPLWVRQSWSWSQAPFGPKPVLKLGILLPLFVRSESDRHCSGGKRMTAGYVTILFTAPPTRPPSPTGPSQQT